MPGPDDARLILGAEGCDQIGLGAGLVREDGDPRAQIAKVLRHMVDKRAVGVAGDRIEGDQPRQMFGGVTGQVVKRKWCFAEVNHC